MKQNDYHKQKPNSKSTPSLLANLRSNDQLMEEILSKENMFKALNKVIQNAGSAGVDGMDVNELKGFLKANWLSIRSTLLDGTYQPSPVRMVAIPKATGGIRELGIPTVLDRLIQQAIMQVLQHHIDGCFSTHSYGFRPGRSAHEAIFKSQEYIKKGRKYIVDIDLEKYFDTVNHDQLMSQLKKNIKDQRVLNLIRRYLNTGVTLEERREAGVPQGSPLSPLLSNIYLHKLDKELESRGHTFVRYADDCQIFVKSEKAAERVMNSLSRYLERKLKLKVNRYKSQVSQTCEFLGYTIMSKELRISKGSLKRFKYSIKKWTRRAGGKNLFAVIKGLKKMIDGWYEYFKYQSDNKEFIRLDRWIRRRIRAYHFCALKTGQNRLKEFLKSGLDYGTAYKYAFTFSGPWKTSKGHGMTTLLSNKYLKAIGLISLAR